MTERVKIIYLDRHTGQPVHPAWLAGKEQAAAYAGKKDPKTVTKWIKQGLRYTKNGREFYFKCKWIDEFLEGNGQRGSGQRELSPATKEFLKKKIGIELLSL